MASSAEDIAARARRHSRCVMAGSVATAVVASKSAHAATGVTAMRLESVVWVVAALTNVALSPTFGTKMSLIATGAILGSIAAAMFMDSATPWQRVQRGVASLAAGFLATLGVLMRYPRLAAVDEREWIMLVAGVTSFGVWFAVRWAQKRNVVDETLDAAADRFGVPTNKRRRKAQVQNAPERGEP